MKAPSLSLLTSHNRHIARGVMLAATLYFGWRMSGLLWLLAGQDHAALAKPVLQAANSSAAPFDGSRLASFNVFKFIEKTENTNAAANAPDTALQLKLDGVFVSAETRLSSAIISDQGQGVGKLYKVGDQVAGGATLSAVYVDRVLLKRNGNDEILRFVKTNLLGNDAPPASAPSLKSGTAQVRDMLGQAINRLNNEPDAYIAEMGLISRGQGYEITDNAPSHLRANLGLKAGDKILRLNGQPLGNVQQDKNLLQQIQQSGHARIEIQRGSQTLTIEQNF